MAVLGLGTAAGLVFALPVKTGSVACPPAQEGRTYCLLQHAWAPAGVKLAAAILVTWLLADFVLHRLPAMAARWRSGERPGRHRTDHGRAAVLADSTLAAATWGIVPQPGRQLGWRAVRPAGNPNAASALEVARRAAPLPELPIERIPAPGPPPLEPAPVVITGVRALTSIERRLRARRTGVPRIRIIDPTDQRTRRLRLAGDPALVVSCWSDASSARSLPDTVETTA